MANPLRGVERWVAKSLDAACGADAHPWGTEFPFYSPLLFINRYMG